MSRRVCVAVLFMTSNNAFCSCTVLWFLFLIWILVKHLNKFKDKTWSRDGGGLGPQKQRSLLLAFASCQAPSPGHFSIGVWGLQTVSTPSLAPAHHGPRGPETNRRRGPAPQDSRDPWCSGGNGWTGAGLNAELWGPLPGHWALSSE